MKFTDSHYEYSDDWLQVGESIFVGLGVLCLLLFWLWRLFSLASKSTTWVFPPGSRLNTFAQAFYSKKTYERVFQQWIIDWREEHAEALSKKQFGLARWRHFSGYVVFVMMMATHLVSTVLRGVLKVWRMTGGG